jgi:thymidylate synthase (FAD)
MDRKVNLVSLTMPRIEGLSTAEDIMVYCARVSNPSNQLNLDTGSKLLKYCLKNSHWSVFEQASLTVEINTTRTIARQIIRHRSFCYQEFSQRYAEVKDNAIYLEARTQDNKNRQSSHPTEDPVLTKYWSMAQAEVWHIAQTHYQNALQMGIAKEQARALLPEGMTPSCLYMTGTARSFITYLLTRLDKSTQLEHREIAKEIWLIFKNEFPHTAQALIELHGDIFEDEQSASVQNNDKKNSLA